MDREVFLLSWANISGVLKETGLVTSYSLCNKVDTHRLVIYTLLCDIHYAKHTIPHQPFPESL